MSEQPAYSIHSSNHPIHPEVRLRGTMQFDLRSAEGRDYRIMVSIPDLEAPTEGHPVVYALDGHAIFSTLLEAERAQCRRKEKTRVTPSIIVGIGYPSELPTSSERHYDYTLPVPVDNLPPSRDGLPWPEYGGADRFLRFINQVLKPKVESLLPVNTDHQTLFGHSFGGLFTLHVLFSSPESFRNYVSISPSLHWGQPQIAEEEQQFAMRLQAEAREHHLLIAAGELESDAPFHMLQNACALAKRLAPLQAYGLDVQFREFAGENHGSVVPTAVSTALRTAAL
ncbi:alpha/beta hydrolase [Paenibacillus bovis]|uniref:alpha/beta hydrolase n=1 Tax=Paenibacillus bovis TaxID=1616788 RepID=UPI000761745A|nr:alpha/beta hydrolase-fold protein [Paenibacillus bovis]